MAKEQLEQKLAAFEEAILQRAGAQRNEILQQAEQVRSSALEAEQNRLLATMAERMQRRIAEVQAENRKEISRETHALKRELYQQRETLLGGLLEQVRERLEAFADSAEYEGWFTAKADVLAREFDCTGGKLLVRTADLRFVGKLRVLCPGCEILADDRRVGLGGLLFESPAGFEADWSLDAALAGQREWFCENSGLNFD